MKINEVENELQMSSYTIRYYEKLGLITVKRDRNGYRNYQDEDINKLKRIRFLRELDISLEDIALILQEPEEFQNILKEHVNKLDHKVELLQEIQSTCQDLNEQDVPLLDEIINYSNKDTAKAEQKVLKEIINKSKEVLKPLKTTVIGARCDFHNYLVGLISLFMVSLVMMLLFMHGHIIQVKK